MNTDSTEQPVTAPTNAPDAAVTPPPALQPQPVASGAPDSTASAAQPQPAQPVTPPANSGQLSTVSNTLALTPAAHSSIQRAGVLREIAQTLAGGPRYQLTPNSDGTVTRQPVPLTKGQILTAIALEAIGGSLSGLAQSGPGATARAAAAGYQQGFQQKTQAQQQAEAQAEQDAANKSKALVTAATLHELASRAILNTQTAERLGIATLKDAITQNATLLQSYQDTGAVTDSHVTQDALLSGMKSGQYLALKQTAIPDGWTNVNGRWEQTFSIVANPSAKVPLTQQDVDKFSAGHVRGFPARMKIPDGYQVPGYIIANANQQLLANKFMLQEAGDVTNTLAKSDDPNVKKMAAGIPNFSTLMDDPKQGLAFQYSLPKLQKYLHHDGTGDDFYQALVAMSQPTRPNPLNPKQMIPNSSDANAAQVIAGAFGNGDPSQGWKVLRAYHDQITPAPITSESQAESILSDSASSPRQIAHAKKYLAVAAHQKASEVGAQARARQSAEGTGGGTLNVSALTPKEYESIVDGIGSNTLDASQMLRYGKADQLKILADVKAKYPGFDATQYQANLGLAKWATSGKGGDQIQALNTLHQHAADFLENMTQLGNLDTAFLNTPINKLKSMSGNPNVTATIARMLAVRTEYLNTLNNNHALTKEDKADAQQLLNENQSPAQWRSVLNQIQHTADLRGAETNARYRATFGKDMPNYHPPQSQGGQHVVPAGATPGRDAKGNIIGYRTATGQVVRF